MNEVKTENAEFVVQPCEGGRWYAKPGESATGGALPACTVCHRLMVSHDTFLPTRWVGWREEVPTKKGWYWYRPNGLTHKNFHARSYMPAAARKLGEASILRVDEDIIRKRFIVRFPGTQFDVVALAGEWAGPIPRPWR